MREAAQIAGDPRQGAADDILVERRQRQRRHEAGEREPELASRQRAGALRLDGGGHCNPSVGRPSSRRVGRLWLGCAAGASRRTGEERRSLPAYRIVIKDLTLTGRIGMLDREKLGPQRIRVNVALLATLPDGVNDDYRRVLNYETVVAGIRALVKRGHVNLLETLAERIMAICLDHPLALAATVRVEKLDIYAEADSAGVVLTRRRR
jgi:dihydroneopterin aldolase